MQKIHQSLVIFLRGHLYGRGVVGAAYEREKDEAGQPSERS